MAPSTQLLPGTGSADQIRVEDRRMERRPAEFPKAAETWDGRLDGSGRASKGGGDEESAGKENSRFIKATMSRTVTEQEKGGGHTNAPHQGEMMFTYPVGNDERYLVRPLRESYSAGDTSQVKAVTGARTGAQGRRVSWCDDVEEMDGPSCKPVSSMRSDMSNVSNLSNSELCQWSKEGKPPVKPAGREITGNPNPRGVDDEYGPKCGPGPKFCWSDSLGPKFCWPDGSPVGSYSSLGPRPSETGKGASDLLRARGGLGRQGGGSFNSSFNAQTDTFRHNTQNEPASSSYNSRNDSCNSSYLAHIGFPNAMKGGRIAGAGRGSTGGRGRGAGSGGKEGVRALSSVRRDDLLGSQDSGLARRPTPMMADTSSNAVAGAADAELWWAEQLRLSENKREQLIRTVEHQVILFTEVAI
ncbi:hypothetical protein CBR_g34168 [Chara braunii]|uniref:Uncharacterized protein n=1 Tax=Chara braunii TaxID=69332 RepID=A0A388LI53_CHABU|nr:hypothetical protein CBR_g34168 [Chara braunii]|eukprot:GBG81988.1 hypothetical protein CBR_g34168 [Chara braunii]